MEYFVHIAQERCYVILATEIGKTHTFVVKGGRNDTADICYQQTFGNNKTILI